jgi:predicted aspartyl protease
VVCLAALLLGCAAVTSCLSPTDCDCSSPADAGVVLSVPIEFLDDLPSIAVRVEGVGHPLRLILDTGGMTVIRADLAAEIEAMPDPSLIGARGTDADGTPLVLPRDPVLLKRLSIGSMDFDAVPAAVVDSAVFDQTCPPFDGVLGTGGLSRTPGFLDRVAIEIDRDHRRARLTRRSMPLAAGTTVAPLRRYQMTTAREKVDDSGTFVPVLLQGHALWALLDTGASGLSTMTRDVFENVLGRTLDDSDLRTYTGEYTMSGAGPKATAHSWIASIPDVVFGAFGFESVEFRIVERRSDGVPMIGLNQGLLQYFNLVLDYPHSEVRLSAAGAGSGHPDLPLQLAWDVRDGRLVVVGLLEGGAAQQADIRLGDEVVMVGDAAVDSTDRASICMARAELRRPDGTVHLVLRRDGKDFEAVLPRLEPASVSAH